MRSKTMKSKQRVGPNCGAWKFLRVGLLLQLALWSAALASPQPQPQPQTTSAARSSSLYSVHEHATGLAGGADWSAMQPVARQPPKGMRAVFKSEYELRSMVQLTKYNLLGLKRDFAHQIVNIYLAIKEDKTIGNRKASKLNSVAGVANILLAAEFADIAIKKYTIQRRLMSDMQLLFARLMPMDRLVELYTRYRWFAWLRNQHQFNLRNILPHPFEDYQVEILYRFIELRAQIRAVDDVTEMTSDNFERILQVLRWFLLQWRSSGPTVTEEELAAMAKHANTMLEFHSQHIVGWAEKMHLSYEDSKEAARPLFSSFGGERNFLHFVDQLIDVEMLHINLDTHAQQLDSPPTIDAQMVDNLALQWVPKIVLKWLEDDRILLIEKRELIKHLVGLRPDKPHTVLGTWSDVGSWLSAWQQSARREARPTYSPSHKLHQHRYK